MLPSRPLLGIASIPESVEDIAVRVAPAHVPRYASVNYYKPVVVVTCTACLSERYRRSVRRTFENGRKEREAMPDCTCKAISPDTEGGTLSRQYILEYAGFRSEELLPRAFPRLPKFMETWDSNRIIRANNNLPQPGPKITNFEPYTEQMEIAEVAISRRHDDAVAEIQQTFAPFEAQDQPCSYLHRWRLISEILEETTKNMIYTPGYMEVYEWPPIYYTKALETVRYVVADKSLEKLLGAAENLNIILRFVQEKQVLLDDAKKFIPNHWLEHYLYNFRSHEPWQPLTYQQYQAKRDLLDELRYNILLLRRELLQPNSTEAKPIVARAIHTLIAHERSGVAETTKLSFRPEYDEEETHFALKVAISHYWSEMQWLTSYTIMALLATCRRQYAYVNIVHNLREVLCNAYEEQIEEREKAKPSANKKGTRARVRRRDRDYDDEGDSLQNEYADLTEKAEAYIAKRFKNRGGKPNRYATRRANRFPPHDPTPETKGMEEEEVKLTETTPKTTDDANNRGNSSSSSSPEPKSTTTDETQNAARMLKQSQPPFQKPLDVTRQLDHLSRALRETRVSRGLSEQMIRQWSTEEREKGEQPKPLPRSVVTFTDHVDEQRTCDADVVYEKDDATTTTTVSNPATNDANSNIVTEPTLSRKRARSWKALCCIMAIMMMTFVTMTQSHPTTMPLIIPPMSTASLIRSPNFVYQIFNNQININPRRTTFLRKINLDPLFQLEALLQDIKRANNKFCHRNTPFRKEEEYFRMMNSTVPLTFQQAAEACEHKNMHLPAVSNRIQAKALTVFMDKQDIKETPAGIVPPFRTIWQRKEKSNRNITLARQLNATELRKTADEIEQSYPDAWQYLQDNLDAPAFITGSESSDVRIENLQRIDEKSSQPGQMLIHTKAGNRLFYYRRHKGRLRVTLKDDADLRTEFDKFICQVPRRQQEEKTDPEKDILQASCFYNENRMSELIAETTKALDPLRHPSTIAREPKDEPTRMIVTVQARKREKRGVIGVATVATLLAVAGTLHFSGTVTKMQRFHDIETMLDAHADVIENIRLATADLEESIATLQAHIEATTAAIEVNMKQHVKAIATNALMRDAIETSAFIAIQINTLYDIVTSAQNGVVHPALLNQEELNDLTNQHYKTSNQALHTDINLVIPHIYRVNDTIFAALTVPARTPDSIGILASIHPIPFFKDGKKFHATMSGRHAVFTPTAYFTLTDQEMHDCIARPSMCVTSRPKRTALTATCGYDEWYNKSQCIWEMSDNNNAEYLTLYNRTYFSVPNKTEATVTCDDVENPQREAYIKLEKSGSFDLAPGCTAYTEQGTTLQPALSYDSTYIIQPLPIGKRPMASHPEVHFTRFPAPPNITRRTYLTWTRLTTLDKVTTLTQERSTTAIEIAGRIVAFIIENVATTGFSIFILILIIGCIRHICFAPCLPLIRLARRKHQSRKNQPASNPKENQNRIVIELCDKQEVETSNFRQPEDGPEMYEIPQEQERQGSETPPPIYRSVLKPMPSLPSILRHMNQQDETEKESKDKK